MLMLELELVRFKILDMEMISESTRLYVLKVGINLEIGSLLEGVRPQSRPHIKKENKQTKPIDANVLYYLL